MKKTLQEIWKEVLELENLPDTDVSFFDLGGNSFSATQVIAELETRANKTAEVIDFYEHETIDDFVTTLK